jgi:hypothetical protein
MQGLETAWVITFNAGQHDEGVYTHSHIEHGLTSVLAFECSDDADRFAQQLLTKGFDPSWPICWSADRLMTFCHTTGFEVSIVPKGTQPRPPSERRRGPLRRFGGPDAAPGPMNPGPDPQFRLWLGPDRPGPWSRFPPSPHGYYNQPLQEERMKLEEILPLSPENCEDDDCTLPAEDESGEGGGQ